jgi:photosystem II stability/assembly factor-like uncharacterized protein
MHRLLVAGVLLLTACPSSPHWSVPLPALDRVPLSVAQPAPDEAWIVGGALGSGGNALALHYDGERWNRVDFATDATLWWVSNDRSPWIVGERGTVFAPGSMTAEPVPTTATLYGVWASPQGDVWIVGGDPDISGVILHGRAGGPWMDVTPAGTAAAFFKVWGSSESDVWICGQNGALLHWDGAALSAVDSGVTRLPLLTVAGRDADDIYAVGGLGSAVVLHHEQGGWVRLGDPIFSTLPGLAGVSVDRDGTTVIVGGGGTKLRGRAGGTWADESAQATRADLHAANISGGDVYVVGGNYQAPPGTARQGVVAHYGGDVSSTIQ